MWLLFALISMGFYAFAEMFQKQGSDLREEHTELKIAIWFGIVSGVTALAIRLLGLKESSAGVVEIVRQNPLMLCSPALYYLSLLASFIGFRLIPASIGSPITCTDGVFTFIGVVLLYFAIGKGEVLDENITAVKVILVILLSVGVFATTLLQSRKEDREENRELAGGRSLIRNGRFAVPGMILMILSAMLDASSSLTDLYFLGELADSYDYIYAVSLMDAGIAVVLYIVLWIVDGKPYRIIGKAEVPRILGAGFDAAGMLFYMIAAAGNQIYTNILISGFCALTVILSRWILKEKIGKKQAFWVGFTVVCILAFSVVDEMF